MSASQTLTSSQINVPSYIPENTLAGQTISGPGHLQVSISHNLSGRLASFQLLLKRVIDVVISLFVLVEFSPTLIALTLLVGLTSRGPILYKSLRIGKDQKPFYMYKFRTMQVDADQYRDELREKANLQGTLFKLENDPRVTWVGKFLRATSLDELPQIINVLKGEMSLVGPRPLPPDESQLFEAPFDVRFQVLPGITGIWQVSGRSHLDFKTLCNLEFTYVMQWSLLQDIKILFKTIPTVLLRRGAH